MVRPIDSQADYRGFKSRLGVLLSYSKFLCEIYYEFDGKDNVVKKPSQQFKVCVKFPIPIATAQGLKLMMLDDDDDGKTHTVYTGWNSGRNPKLVFLFQLMVDDTIIMR